MAKKILTQEDLDLRPELVEAGHKAGDEIEDNESNTNTLDDDTGGSQPPPGKKRP